MNSNYNQKLKILLTKPFLNDYWYNYIRYALIFKKLLNIRNPQTFNEKIIKRKLLNRDDLSTLVADKYEVRNYVEEIMGSNILVKLYYVTENTQDINFDLLPDKFVIKATHGSGWIIIVEDKNKINKQQIINLCAEWLKMNYYDLGREWPYKNIKPRIIIEELLVDNNNNLPIDIKCFCFMGEVKMIQLDLDRFSNHSRALFDSSWNRLPVKLHFPYYDGYIEKPKYLDELISYSEKLSKQFDFVRVDLYPLNDKIYFGELTHYPGGGFEKFTPNEYDVLLGSYIK